ncbi:type II toxin-antitoxin system HicA family toxin [Cohnella thailandensis]|uniref:Type II toxin-antitoxin system HicA family toxin n=1 Tax=Cohnella thailandensis TaxID=557557 RepID=A0A841T335_9BACL|nr:type II toxin-antitoxin system HicA family toxin [Cohnella thailandensis]
MPRIEKLVEKMKNQPHNIRYPEAVKVLEHYGYQLVRTNGSHRHFRNSTGMSKTERSVRFTRGSSPLFRGGCR